MKHKLVASAFAALSAGSMAFAGSADDWLSTTDDTAIIRSYGTRHVCVFTNTASAVTLTLKQAMTLEEYLVVGGGGSGGNAVGGGGGGGGVVYSGEPQGVAAAAQFEIAVGAGGEQRKDQKMSGLQGGHSTLSFGGQTIYGYGGGGGGGYSEAVPAAAVQNQIGSGGGAGRTNSIGTDGQQWNSQQGHGGALANDVIGGGGGGAGSAGDWDRGGEGCWFSITGRAVAYGSGGGAGINSSVGFGGKGGTNAGNGGISAASPATPGVDGTGGGGGSGGVGLTNLGGKGGSGAVVLVFSEAAATVSRFGILPIRDQLYVNSAVRPLLTVTNAEGAVLSPDADYSVSYVGNEGAGDAVAVVQGAEDTPYAGYTAICPFRIHEVAYEDENILASDASFYTKAVGQRMVYVFTNAGETVVFRTKRMLTRDNLLLVGGGGSGGSRYGGGGGGGGYVAQDGMNLVEAGREGCLQVGEGAEVRPANSTHGAPGRQGGHTWLDFGGESTVYAYGGGGGGSAYSTTPMPASAAAAYNEIGSGGGDSSAGTVGWQWNAEQGHSGSAGRGANTRGGGGGALLAAVPGKAPVGLDGGEGRTNDITGISVVYGSGGGGYMNATTPSYGGTNAGAGAAAVGGGDGVDGTGAGGGGGGVGTVILGGRGGSGIAVLSFLPGDQINYRDEYILTPDKTVRRIDLPGRTVYVFTNVADEAVQVTALKRFKVRQALVVGGGGGGGKSIGGGGGGGGVVYSNRLSQVVEEASVLTVKVGGGGEGFTKATESYSTGTQGGHSSLTIGGLSLVAYGGGGGAGYLKTPSAAAEEGEIGSGGGSSRAGIGTLGFQWQQGFAGGSTSDANNAAGGGGASETGQPGFKGGEGLAIGITGSDVVYGSGGGGGARYSATATGVPGAGGTNAGAGGNNSEGTPGIDGTGSGGGGGGRSADAPTVDWVGGRGGSGTVILSVSPINGLMIILK